MELIDRMSIRQGRKLRRHKVFGGEEYRYSTAIYDFFEIISLAVV